MRKFAPKFKVGEKVFLKKSIIKWHLEKAHDLYFPPSGTLDHEQQKQYDAMVISFLVLSLDPNIVGKVTQINWPHSKELNYKVKILDMESNFEPKNLEKV
jgi:hypothetical protein